MAKRKRNPDSYIVGKKGRAVYGVHNIQGETPPESIALLKEGEHMKCSFCGAEHVFIEGQPSQWRVLDADGHRSYFCPDEFPPDEVATREDFAIAYQLCLAQVMIEKAERSDKEISTWQLRQRLTVLRAAAWWIND